MKIRTIILAVAVMCLYHVPQAQPGLGIQFETQAIVQRFAKQNLPGTVLAKDSRYQAEFRNGLLIGARLVYGFSDEFEMSAGFLAGRRTVWQATGTELAALRHRNIKSIQVLPVEFAWTPLLRPEGKVRLVLSPGGALIWNNSIRMQGAVNSSQGYDPTLRAKLDAIKKRPGEPLPLLSFGAGFQWALPHNTAMRFTLNYQTALARDFRIAAEWGRFGQEESLTDEYRTRFFSFRFDFVLPFRVFKGKAPGNV